MLHCQAVDHVPFSAIQKKIKRHLQNQSIGRVANQHTYDDNHNYNNNCNKQLQPHN